MNLKALSRAELESQYKRLSAEFLKMETLAGDAVLAYSKATAAMAMLRRIMARAGKK